jgi:hypothetical protein
LFSFNYSVLAARHHRPNPRLRRYWDFSSVLFISYNPVMPCVPADFRRFALALPQTEQRSHMNHPDFRVAGKIFATLGYPNKERGMVKLTPAQQQDFVAAHPKAFQPVTGAWGRKGCTSVLLAKATKRALKEAIVTAWRNYAPSELALASLPRKARKKS